MLSFWEENSLLSADVVVVGSGIVGLSTAVSIKERDHSKSVVVLERGWLPTGASTKNAGFACFGSLTELLADLEIMSEAEVIELVQMRWDGLTKLKNRLGEAAIGFKNQGGYELIEKDNAHVIEHIDRVNELLYPIFKAPVFQFSDDKIESFGFNGSQVSHLIENRFEGQIDTGAMMDTLWEYANKLGIRVITGMEVSAYEEIKDNVILKVKAQGETDIEFTANQVVFCTNAFSKSFFPTEDLAPGRGQVLVTHPIPNLKLKGTFHVEEGYYYFRDYNNRIVLGGGRNLDFEGEETTEIALNHSIQAHLVKMLKEVILPQTEFTIDKKWAGIMAFGQNKQVICKRISDKVIAGIRLGGMGVAIGSKLGEELAELYFES